MRRPIFPSFRSLPLARGFSLMECLMLVMILGIVGAGAGSMLIAVAKSPRDTDLQFQIETDLISKMESLRGQAFDSLTVGTSFSDTIPLNNITYYRTVTIDYADANGDGVNETNFKTITVTVGGQSVTTLVNKP